MPALILTKAPKTEAGEKQPLTNTAGKSGYLPAEN
jgi:hypothetical protein